MYIENIRHPDDLKLLDTEQLKLLCEEIRGELIKTVSANGGHLASNLGIVEITVGIHRVFNSPQDSVLFDVGHQSYVHKILTGRYDRFSTIRLENGLTGFMNPNESKHDSFVSGHSSNSISAAYGIASANALQNNDHYVIPVIGDGALTGGMAFEGLNNAGKSGDKMIIILNDNKMSISRNVGGLARHLTKVRIEKRYIKTKEKIRNGFYHIPVIGGAVGKFATVVKRTLKNALYNSNFFESLGYYYLGPIDGNNIEAVTKTLEAAKAITRPVIIHAITVKGKGYSPAEKSPTLYHGVSSYDIETGYCASDDCYSNVFGKKLCELAEKDSSICAITAAMTEGTGLVEFRERFKDRLFDAGIAEQHAMTFSCGLASKGFRPVFAVYSSFLQRAYDQIVHDGAICDYNVTICIDRAGIVGSDGATHQGIFDVAFMNTIPNIAVYSPAYYDGLRNALSNAIYVPGLCAVRYPRGNEMYKPSWYKSESDTYDLHGEGKAVAVTYGRLFSNVAEAYDKSNGAFAVCKINRIKPLPETLIKDISSFERVVFYEEGIEHGGVGEQLGCCLLKAGFKGKFELKAIKTFVPQSSIESAFKKLGFDTESIITAMAGE